MAMTTHGLLEANDSLKGNGSKKGSWEELNTKEV